MVKRFIQIVTSRLITSFREYQDHVLHEFIKSVVCLISNLISIMLFCITFGTIHTSFLERGHLNGKLYRFTAEF